MITAITSTSVYSSTSSSPWSRGRMARGAAVLPAPTSVRRRMIGLPASTGSVAARRVHAVGLRLRKHRFGFCRIALFEISKGHREIEGGERIVERDGIFRVHEGFVSAAVGGHVRLQRLELFHLWRPLNGGRTGLTSIVTGIAFLLSMFLAPLAEFGEDPSAADPALVEKALGPVEPSDAASWDIVLASIARAEQELDQATIDVAMECYNNTECDTGTGGELVMGYADGGGKTVNVWRVCLATSSLLTETLLRLSL